MTERRCSLLLRRFVFRMAEASAKRVTGDEPQGTMGRVQTAGEVTGEADVSPVVSFPPSFARTSRETSGYEAGGGAFWDVRKKKVLDEAGFLSVSV